MEFSYILPILVWILAGAIVVTDGAVLPPRHHEQGHNDAVDSTSAYLTSVAAGYRISSVSPAGYNYTTPKVANVSAETTSTSNRNIASGPSPSNRPGNATKSNAHPLRPLTLPTIAVANPLVQTNNGDQINEEQDNNTRACNASALSRGDVIAIASCIGTFVSILVAVLALWIARQTLKKASESAAAAAALAGRSFLRKFFGMPPK